MCTRRAIQTLVAKGDLDLDVTVHERLVSGTKTLQLETFAGGLLACFDNAKMLAYVVPRYALKLYHCINLATLYHRLVVLTQLQAIQAIVSVKSVRCKLCHALTL